MGSLGYHPLSILRTTQGQSSWHQALSSVCTVRWNITLSTRYLLSGCCIQDAALKVQKGVFSFCHLFVYSTSTCWTASGHRKSQWEQHAANTPAEQLVWLRTTPSPKLLGPSSRVEAQSPNQFLGSISCIIGTPMKTVPNQDTDNNSNRCSSSPAISVMLEKYQLRGKESKGQSS